MKTKILLVIGFMFMISGVFAQERNEIIETREIVIKKDDYRSKDDYKKAKSLIKEAEPLFALGRGGYRRALDKYLEAYQLNPNNDILNLRIGICYLYSIQKTKSIKYFEKAYELNHFVDPKIMFYLARGYHLNYQFDKAIEYYNKYKNTLSPRDLQEHRKELEKYVKECETGKELVKHPVRVFIDNVGEAINTSYPEYSPLISTDESVMIFTSRRPDTYGGGRDPGDNMFFEDIYISYKGPDGKWQKAKNIGPPLNTKNNDATVGLSPDGTQLFIFNGRTNGGDIYVSKLEGDRWSKPTDKPLKKYINTEYHESSASFSFDGKTMYFVSNRPDLSYGGHDIFISYWDEKKEIWGKPQNIGPTINTEYDEEGVFMHPDGRTLYFSSKGHNTMGGYDIFKSELQDDGTWSKPVNLGYPINTPDDDVFFVINASGKRGYYSSVKEDGIGDYDIYMITFRGPEKPTIESVEDQLLANTKPIQETAVEGSVKIKTMRLTIVKGTVTDAFTKEPIQATIEVIDNEKNQVISTIKSNAKTGKYLVSLPSGKNYGLNVKADGYLFHSENFNIPKATGYQEIIKDIALNKLQVGSKVVLKNIFFDYAKATLRPESYAELDRLVKLLKDHPNIKIEVSGHTDNRGSLKTNMRLSTARAKAVADYLIGHGISADRITYKGYAYFQPIASNDTEEGRQQNRRVEFKVISNK